MRTWEDCAQFHGHKCPGLAIGYRAAVLAMEKLGLSEGSQDEELVCISENDACGVDAIQVVLGCSIGKGNLLFHMTGKQAFSFFNRKTGKAARLVLRERPAFATKEESFEYMQNREPEELFDVKEPVCQVPENARLFQSYSCDCCGEMTAEHMLRLQGGKKLCLDCWKEYDRFKVF